MLVGGGVDVGQDAQKRGLCRVMAPVRRLSMRQQVVLVEIMILSINFDLNVKFDTGL